MGLFNVETWKKVEPSKDRKFLHGLYDGVFTLFFKPNKVTQIGNTHIKGPMDLKRLMIHVVIALQLCYLYGSYNVGHQHFLALGEHTGVLDALHLKLVIGLASILPLFVVSNLVGLAIEFYFASQKGHPIEEGYLVTGALIPLIMPPDVPLWMLALAIIFSVLLAKEAFGGTGMNVVNIALMARAFIYFAYPTEISGDTPWVSAINFSESVTEYSFLHTMFNPIFASLGWETFLGGQPLLESFTGATPLVLAREGGWEAVTAVYTPTAMFVGNIPGCVGETSKLAVLVGIAILAVTRVASWRIMLSMAVGAAFTGMLFNLWGFNAYMEVPWYNHFLMGSLLFALAFMATDPVSATNTATGKLIYGFLIGFFGMVIRVMNPAYAESWMLAILLMNVFAPTIDYYVVEANIKRRLKRAKAK
ncbi:MAG: NADH:ubiquinone reductase (Na(+)-transporting) subunit B [Aureispira sp.]